MSQLSQCPQFGQKLCRICPHCQPVASTAWLLSGAFGMAAAVSSGSARDAQSIGVSECSQCRGSWLLTRRWVRLCSYNTVMGTLHPKPHWSSGPVGCPRAQPWLPGTAGGSAGPASPLCPGLGSTAPAPSQTLWTSCRAERAGQRRDGNRVCLSRCSHP